MPDPEQQTGWLEAVVDMSSDIVAAVRMDGLVQYANPSARRFRGLGPTDPVTGVSGGDLLDAESMARWQREVVPVLSTGGQWRGELTVMDRNGQAVPVELEVIGHRDEHGELDLVSLIGRDISLRRTLEDRLAHQASHDPLTDLPNRALFLDRLHVSLARSRRTRRRVAVLFFDLDNFKSINDRLGHERGDQVLVALAERLLAAIRPGDTVARLGGDEFVVLCEEVDREDEAEAIAARVAAAVAVPAVVDGHTVMVTASIGVALADDPESAAALLSDADTAMYEAKDRGRARTAVFDTQVRTRAVDRLALGSDLDHALERHQLRVHYQILLDLRAGRAVGVEALLRWQHPERGLLRPGEFLALAEATSAILPIGRWLAGEGCAAVKRIEHELPHLVPLLVTLNLSSAQLADPDLANGLRAVLAQSEIDPQRVRLELNENLIENTVDLTDQTLARLREIGLRLAVEDFGQSLTQPGSLARYPVDLVKIDQGLVAQLEAPLGSRSRVQALVEAAHGLGLRAVAEGVEKAGQLAALRSVGCDLAQGYFIAQPQPVEELLVMLAADPVWWVFDGPGSRTGVWSGWRPRPWRNDPGQEPQDPLEGQNMVAQKGPG